MDEKNHLPIGVVSKNDVGEYMTPASAPLYRLRLAVSERMLEVYSVLELNRSTLMNNSHEDVGLDERS